MTGDDHRIIGVAMESGEPGDLIEVQVPPLAGIQREYPVNKAFPPEHYNCRSAVAEMPGFDPQSMDAALAALSGVAPVERGVTVTEDGRDAMAMRLLAMLHERVTTADFSEALFKVDPQMALGHTAVLPLVVPSPSYANEVWHPLIRYPFVIERGMVPDNAWSVVAFRYQLGLARHPESLGWILRKMGGSGNGLAPQFRSQVSAPWMRVIDGVRHANQSVATFALAWFDLQPDFAGGSGVYWGAYAAQWMVPP